MTFPLIAALFLIGAIQGLFLAAALITNEKGNRRANRYLAAQVTLLALSLIDYCFDSAGISDQAYYINVILWPREFLFGVLLYLYCREMVAPELYKIEGKQWRHFIPSICHVMLTWPLLAFNAEFQEAVLDGTATEGIGRVWGLILGEVEALLALLHAGFYLYLSRKIVIQHKIKMQQQFSSIEKVSLDWLRYSLNFFVLNYIVWWLDVFFHIQEVMGVSILIFVYTMGYLGLRQPRIFAAREASTEDESSALLDIEPTPIDQGEKYQSSALSKELSEALSVQLQSYMQQHKPYLEPDISLPNLSEALGVSVNYMSQVINQQSGQNFFDFINGYRVEEAKRLMNNDSRMNLLDIGLAAGFNAKSSFYNTFKKHTDMTPGAYRKSLKD